MPRYIEGAPRFNYHAVGVSAVERLAEIRIEIEGAKLEKLRAEAESARIAAQPPQYTRYEDYPPPSPEDRDRFIKRMQKMMPPIDDRRNYLLQTLIRDNPEFDVEGLRKALGAASLEASRRCAAEKVARDAQVEATEDDAANNGDAANDGGKSLAPI